MRIRPPVRVTHSYTQSLDGPPGAVFPLLCPVLEREWVPGWDPGMVISESGVAERDCVFTTPEETPSGRREATWVITEHDPVAGRVEMLKLTPGYLLTRLWIHVRPREGGSLAEVTYRYTALGPEGEQYVASRTEAAYADFMRTWENALNDHLRRRAVR
jgi:hypothetical protein